MCDVPLMKLNCCLNIPKKIRKYLDKKRASFSQVFTFHEA